MIVFDTSFTQFIQFGVEKMHILEILGETNGLYRFFGKYRS